MERAAVKICNFLLFLQIILFIAIKKVMRNSAPKPAGMRRFIIVYTPFYAMPHCKLYSVIKLGGETEMPTYIDALMLILHGRNW